VALGPVITRNAGVATRLPYIRNVLGVGGPAHPIIIMAAQRTVTGGTSSTRYKEKIGRCNGKIGKGNGKKSKMCKRITGMFLVLNHLV
jgi:hypothetical protein